MAPHVTLRPPLDEGVTVHLAHPPSRHINLMYGGDPDQLPQASLERSIGWLAWLRAHGYARIILADGRPVGEVRLHSEDAARGSARLAIGLFSEDDLGQGIGRQAVRLTLDHAFGPMGLRRVDLRVLDFNARAIACYRACGFAVTERVPKALERDGVWYDDLVMAIERGEGRANSV